MAIGVLQMYMDMNIANSLRAKYGSTSGVALATFFEEWRNYGQEYVMQNYSQRTYYYYLDRLIETGFIIRVRQGVYKITESYENPIKLR